MGLRAYNLFRNHITREIKKAKKVYYKNYFHDNINNMKNLWKSIKNILNINKKEDSCISQALSSINKFHMQIYLGTRMFIFRW